jgi:hypothetical protein
VRRIIIIAGVILAASGAAMNELLTLLRMETFRADLPPWMNASFVVAGAGIIFILGGAALPKRELERIDVMNAARYFVYVAVVNTVAAAVFSLPVLIPTFEFPILITRWPGIYMVIAYTFFIVVGVLGTFAWSVFYRWIPDFFTRGSVFRAVFLFQISAMEVGIYLMSVFMFLGGYVGSALVNQGLGDTVIGTAMEFTVIPSALGIFLSIMSALAGVANVLVSKKSGY